MEALRDSYTNWTLFFKMCSLCGLKFSRENKKPLYTLFCALFGLFPLEII